MNLFYGNENNSDAQNTLLLLILMYNLCQLSTHRLTWLTLIKTLHNVDKIYTHTLSSKMHYLFGGQY